MPALENIFLLLGSNLGDKIGMLRQARLLISRKAGTIISESSLYETEPWGLQDQPAFLNQVIEICSELAPVELLSTLLEIEQKLGRVRLERWGSRLIDIDLLYYGNYTLESETLTLPHPRISERRFTLVPLSEIAPDWVDPNTQKRVEQMLADCPDTSEVSKVY